MHLAPRRRLFRRRNRIPVLITFAVGDIHGHLRKLDALLTECWRYNARLGAGTRPRFIFLGDYVDRGPDSKGVIDRIIELRRQDKCDVVTIFGNHEALMLGAMHHKQPDIKEMFLIHGGRETLDSYGTTAEFRETFERHINEFFAKLALYHDDGMRFYCHAGVDHAKPLHTQSDTVMLWGPGCVNEEIDPGRYVVHGHIVVPVAVPEAHHINVDTGAYSGGPLSCAVFNDEKMLPIAVISNENGVEWEF